MKLNKLQYPFYLAVFLFFFLNVLIRDTFFSKDILGYFYSSLISFVCSILFYFLAKRIKIYLSITIILILIIGVFLVSKNKNKQTIVNQKEIIGEWAYISEEYQHHVKISEFNLTMSILPDTTLFKYGYNWVNDSIIKLTEKQNGDVYIWRVLKIDKNELVILDSQDTITLNKL